MGLILMFNSATTFIILFALYILGESAPAQNVGMASIFERKITAKRENTGTFFTPHNDACSDDGGDSRSTDLVAALSWHDIGQEENGPAESAEMCNRCVKVTGPEGTVVVKIVDLCATCSPGDVDLTEAAFEKIGELSSGRVEITWAPTKC